SPPGELERQWRWGDIGLTIAADSAYAAGATAEADELMHILHGGSGGAGGEAAQRLVTPMMNGTKGGQRNLVSSFLQHGMEIALETRGQSGGAANGAFARLGGMRISDALLRGSRTIRDLGRLGQQLNALLQAGEFDVHSVAEFAAAVGEDA